MRFGLLLETSPTSSLGDHDIRHRGRRDDDAVRDPRRRLGHDIHDRQATGRPGRTPRPRHERVHARRDRWLRVGGRHRRAHRAAVRCHRPLLVRVLRVGDPACPDLANAGGDRARPDGRGRRRATAEAAAHERRPRPPHERTPHMIRAALARSAGERGEPAGRPVSSARVARLGTRVMGGARRGTETGAARASAAVRGRRGGGPRGARRDRRRDGRAGRHRPDPRGLSRGVLLRDRHGQRPDRTGRRDDQHARAWATSSARSRSWTVVRGRRPRPRRRPAICCR